MDDKQKTAILVIGDEVLSGRTKDTNSGWLATELGAIGLPVGEIRVVADVQDRIVAALNELRARYKYIFTTGGIGPTHDDITADAIAAAFGVVLPYHPEARMRLTAYIGAEKMNEARLRMARIPEGAALIDNPLTAAPGFCIENVFVMAGVPKIMQVMFNGVADTLEHGAPVVMRALATNLKEGDFAAGLEALQKQFPDVSLGSYPHYTGDKSYEAAWVTQLLAKGLDASRVDAAIEAIRAMLIAMGDSPADVAAR